VLKLAILGLLSTNGRPKVVISAHDVQAAISKTVDDVARDKAYTLQIISLILILLYTGVRLGSFIATERGIATTSVDHWYKSQQMLSLLKTNS
jgi:hypothetical protein